MSDQTQAPAQAKDPEAVDRSDAQAAPPAYGLPPQQLTLKSGTYITVRTNQALSSDHNQVGDMFSASLMQPLVLDGILVAPRGQIVMGRVAEAQKAHGGKDSRLGLEITSITLADGTQAAIHSQLVVRQGPHTPATVEAGTVLSTATAGAAVGGIAGRGTGAAIGAGAGAAAGLAAVFMTHNHPTNLYPETALTFAVTEPLTISTVNAPQAFHYVTPDDYQGNVTRSGPPARPERPGYMYGPGYPYPYYPYYWGPGLGIGVRFGGFYGRRW